MPNKKQTCGKVAITPMNYREGLCRLHLRARKSELVAEFIKVQAILKADVEKTYR